MFRFRAGAADQLSPALSATTTAHARARAFPLFSRARARAQACSRLVKADAGDAAAQRQATDCVDAIMKRRTRPPASAGGGGGAARAARRRHPPAVGRERRRRAAGAGAGRVVRAPGAAGTCSWPRCSSLAVPADDSPSSEEGAPLDGHPGSAAAALQLLSSGGGGGGRGAGGGHSGVARRRKAGAEETRAAAPVAPPRPRRDLAPPLPSSTPPGSPSLWRAPPARAEELQAAAARARGPPLRQAPARLRRAQAAQAAVGRARARLLARLQAARRQLARWEGSELSHGTERWQQQLVVLHEQGRGGGTSRQHALAQQERSSRALEAALRPPLLRLPASPRGTVGPDPNPHPSQVARPWMKMQRHLTHQRAPARRRRRPSPRRRRWRTRQPIARAHAPSSSPRSHMDARATLSPQSVSYYREAGADSRPCRRAEVVRQRCRLRRVERGTRHPEASDAARRCASEKEEAEKEGERRGGRTSRRPLVDLALPWGRADEEAVRGERRRGLGAGRQGCRIATERGGEATAPR